MSDLMIENFYKENHLNWTIINDGVMGGVSEGSMEILPDHKGRFAGNVSLENNGGFTSVRAMLTNIDLRKIRTLKIRVKGDGKKYSFRIRTDESFDGISYKIEFDTKKDQWTIHEFFLMDFVPTFRGRILEAVPPVEAAKIIQIGFLIADKQAGNFELLMDWIKGAP